MAAGLAPQPARRRPRKWVTALFALTFATFGTIQAVYAFAGDDTYRDLVLPEAPRDMALSLASGGTWSFSRELLVVFHRQTLAYVLGNVATLPKAPDGSSLFSDDEAAHLVDVRRVFEAVRIAWAAAAIALVALVLRARPRGYASRLVRDGALWAAALLLVMAAAFAIAFEPAFMAFHYVFFPQGNFLFDPATSHLLLVYPERYWYGVTLRVGASFIASAVAIAAAAALLDRERSAIVRTR